MSFLDTLRGGDKRKDITPPGTDGYADALARCLAAARLRQLRLGEVIGGRDWRVDFERGEITFGGDTYPLAFIGSESHDEGIWLWGVENINGFAEPLISDVCAFYNGELMAGLPRIHRPSLQLDDLVHGHHLSSLFTAWAREPMCYYRCPYQGGAAYVAVKNLPDSVFAPPGATELTRIISELLGAGGLAHRPLAEGALEAACVSVEEYSGGLRGTFGCGDVLKIAFDNAGRIASMKSTLQGERA